jgi:TorA maturation chaperone TorD
LDKQYRTYLYAFLSRVFSNALDETYLKELQQNDELLSLLGEKSFNWFKTTSLETIAEELNIDYSSIFLMNAKPIESSILDAKDEILVGLQNPVMQFYFNHNYELNLAASHLQTPDHISIEFAFMQNLIAKNEILTQKEFLKAHLLKWAVPYFLGVKQMAKTPFYKDLSDFTIEFLASDYDFLVNELN